MNATFPATMQIISASTLRVISASKKVKASMIGIERA
jgi:hypothetical protein